MKLRHAYICLALVHIPGCTSTEGGNEAAPRPEFTVSRETTFATEPLHQGGYVDFATAINRRFGQGVTSDNNACRPLYAAIGPSTMQIDMHDWLWGPNQIGAFFEKIGAQPRIYKERSSLDEIRPTSSRYEHFQSYEHPDSWFDEVFRLLHEAARRDRYYSPLITNGAGDGRSQALFGASYPSDVAVECAAQLLLTRASVVDSREAEWKDLLASYRLRRLLRWALKSRTLCSGLRSSRRALRPCSTSSGASVTTLNSSRPAEPT